MHTYYCRHWSSLAGVIRNWLRGRLREENVVVGGRAGARPGVHPTPFCSSELCTMWSLIFASRSRTFWFQDCYRWNVCVPPNSHIETQPPTWLYLAMKPLGGELVMHVEPSLMGLMPLREKLALFFCHVKTQREDSCLWSRKRVLTRHQIRGCLDLGLPSLQNCEK